MQKRFIAVSTAAVALALVFAFSARTARADSIHSHDLKFESFAPLSNSCDLMCVLDSVFVADRGEIAEFFSRADSDRKGREIWAGVPPGSFGFPVASHFYHRAGDGNPRSSNVPEPSSLLLAAFGLTGIALLRKSRRTRPPFPPAAV
jgi:hypothetical protein